MKKALIITLNQVEKLSGIEMYNKKLVTILSNLGFEVDEFSFIKSKEFANSVLSKRYYVHDEKTFLAKNWFFRNFLYRNKLEKEVNKLINSTSYDLIINSTNCAIKSIMWNDNYIWVQHFDSNFIYYSNNHITLHQKLNGFIFRVLLKLLNLKTPIKNSKHIVTFYDKFIPPSMLSKKVIYHYIPICKYDFDKNFFDLSSINYLDKLKSNILYIGRIEDRQKNLSFLANNFTNIDYYGPVIDNRLLNKIKDNYKGIIKNEEELKDIISMHSYVILSSYYEGFPTVFVESLSYATPIISSNQIKANEFFFTTNLGYILDITKNQNKIFSFNDVEINKYKLMCQNAYEFAKKNLNESEFINKWTKIIKNY